MKESKRIKSIWCYSIYGDDIERYYQPMILNINHAIDVGADIFIHTNKKYEEKVFKYFFNSKLKDNIIVHDGIYANQYPKVLRFLTCNFIASDYYFFKDSDSVVTEKEKLIMKEWINSVNPTALIMRDHPLHIAPIMAGMFGVNRELSIKIADSALGYFSNPKLSHFNSYSYDQEWLARNIYPKIVGSAYVNTSFFYYSGERVKRINREIDGHKFIGAQVYKSVSIGPVPPDPYMNLYGEDLLSLPYFSKLAVLYGKVRPTLYVAYLINKIKKYYFS